MTYWLVNSAIICAFGVLLPVAAHLWVCGGLRNALRIEYVRSRRLEEGISAFVVDALYAARWRMIPPTLAKGTMMLTLVGGFIAWLCSVEPAYPFGITIGWASWIHRWVELWHQHKEEGA